jgi:hypothetical protein
MTEPKSQPKAAAATSPSEAEALLLDVLPEGVPRDAVVRALAQAHRRKAVAITLVNVYGSIEADSTAVLLPTGSVDLVEPYMSSELSVSGIFDVFRLDAHDRATVAGFVASIEGHLAVLDSESDRHG